MVEPVVSLCSKIILPVSRVQTFLIPISLMISLFLYTLLFFFFFFFFSAYINHARCLLPGEITSTRAVCVGNPKVRTRSSWDSNPGLLVRKANALPLHHCTTVFHFTLNESRLFSIFEVFTNLKVAIFIFVLSHHVSLKVLMST